VTDVAMAALTGPTGTATTTAAISRAGATTTNETETDIRLVVYLHLFVHYVTSEF
jgi:hypothetical protein